MRFHGYQRPHRVGWLGWFTDAADEVVGFLALDGHFHWHHTG